MDSGQTLLFLLFIHGYHSPDKIQAIFLVPVGVGGYNYVFCAMPCLHFWHSIYNRHG